MAVVANGDKFDFVCDRPRCGWSSSGWPLETQADARGTEHYNEHDTGELMTELTAFEASVGFVRDEV